MIATVNLQSEKADTAAGSVLLEQGEGAAVDAEQALLLHAGQLRGHGAAVHGQEIRELLTVKGDAEAGASGAPRLCGQIGQELFARAALRKVARFFI